MVFMDNKLVVKISDEEITTTLNKDGTIDASGNIFSFEELYNIAPFCFYVKVNDKNEFVAFEKKSDTKLQIYFRGFYYEVEVYDPLYKFLKPLANESDFESLFFAKITSPMPGLVVKILCKEGDQVNKGDKVIIIEAMKMENALLTPISGYVEKIYVKEGIAVEKGATLVEISKK